ncbi:MAG: alpha-L-arabinofuranosidase C-terminal domain-containing protein, partial [Heyndrickxia sp.]
YGTPTYHTMKMYANSDITYLVNNKVECDTFHVTSKNNNLKLENLPELDVVSCINENHNLLTVFVVNRSLEEVTVDIRLRDFTCSGKVKVGEITGSSIDSINDVFAPENITCCYKNIEMGLDKMTYPLNAHSIYVFEIKSDN